MGVFHVIYIVHMVPTQCRTQGFFAFTVGNIFSDSRSATMVGAEGREQFETVPF